jgi:HNH endonuclease
VKYASANALCKEGCNLSADLVGDHRSIGYRGGRVYEKLQKGIWADNGFFHLVDADIEHDGHREVFRFRLHAVEDPPSENWSEDTDAANRSPGRVIPSSVKLEVWKRDGGRCVECGATDELHFDHILPFSKGGTSLRASNVQLLCARHNLAKRDHIV